MTRRVSGFRLFIVYVAASAVPLALLGIGLGHLYKSQMDRRSLDQAQSEASAITNAGIQPVVAGRDLSKPLTPAERAALLRATRPLIESGNVLRLRLRDRSGAVVFDASRPSETPRSDPDEEVSDAVRGQTVRRLTRVNRDEVDADSKVGARAVEVYIPVHESGRSNQVLGVLEVYLPYAPIAQSFAASNGSMMALIGLGLLLVWLALSVISASVTNRLRRSAADNEYQAMHDVLTGLPNRALFADRAEHALAAARRSGEPVGIAILDLDRFKEVNDTLGHHNGDTYLRHIAVAVGDALRPGDTLARLGGDEFGLVLPGVDATTARSVLDRVQRVLAMDVDIDGVPVTTEASIGIAFWPTDGTEISELLQFADLAMYAAKETRSALVEYTDELAQYSPARLALISELRHAISSDELVLHYQPKLDLRENRIVSVEALLRWQHPTRGLLYPAEFLDVAESTGLIDPLTEWVLDHGIAQVARWHEDGLMLGIAVNVSARNLRDDTLPDTILERLSAHGVDPEWLRVEITETALIADPTRAGEVLQQLRRRGVCISLDDFGRGYTSLSQLGDLPLAELKIDGSFVGRMLTSASDRTIVNTVIELGHNFGLEVVAEGAETADILTALTELGCDTAQGWALTPALAADELPTWIENYGRAAPVGI
ncbi:MAG TPA: EAL domain-containing protein [Acidimicrobiia bacterium]|jgi:diguanylate cyclase (GGDEF)-like protein